MSIGLGSVRDGSLRGLLGGIGLSSVGGVIATTTSKFKTANTFTFLYNGLVKSFAGTDNNAFSSGHNTVKDGYSCLFVAAIASDASTITTYQGPLYKSEVGADGVTRYRGYRVWTDAAGNVNIEKTSQLVDKTGALLPDVPLGKTPFLILKIAASGADFVPGTTALSGITTYINVGALPSETEAL